MDGGLIKASQRLSELELKIELEDHVVNVYWFRAMFKDHDWYIKRHAHSTFEFHIIARGDCEVILDTGAFSATPGTFFLTAPDVFHTQKPGSSAEFVEYSLNCDIRRTGTQASPAPGSAAWIRSVFLTTPCTLIRDTCGVKGMFESALREAELGLPCHETMIRTIVVMILITAARAMGTAVSTENAEDEIFDGNALEVRIARITEFITDNVRRNLTPSDIASFLSLSERQTDRIVSEAKGYSTKKLITRTKLKFAKDLLCTTDLPIKEIAHELGFSNEYYFSSVFRKHEGFPPGLFRESMKRTRAGSEEWDAVGSE